MDTLSFSILQTLIGFSLDKWWAAGGNVVALPAAPPIHVQSCFGEVAGGCASKSQPVTSQKGKADSYVPDPLSVG